ncbi:hypothetical protein [Aquimarina algicola]|uniref:Uncharacterized protein n=1 Tax=Aquimarina algicola TaxID=2589995 RepID=A0A504JE73_9FLAO|nr:hypothetical protein [Aquimarina algicola]TPN89004.1 hypothetical protein FHK87_01935 [Aquimarina algicola]
MKRLLLPTILIAFAIVCLSIIHIDNVNKLDVQSNELRKKHENHSVDIEQGDSSMIEAKIK